MSSNKEQKTALITGASSGIGHELAKIFAREGYALVLVSRSEPKIELSTPVTYISKDLSKAGAAKEIFGEVSRRGIQIDVLVNNAGFADHGAFAESDLDRQLEMIQLNASSLVALTRLFLPQMMERTSGKILNVASTAAFVPGPYMSVYFATKAFVLSFSESLAEEVAGHGINVTALCPGPTASNFAERAGVAETPLFRGTLTTSKEVAEAGYRALVAGKRVHIPNLRQRILIFLSRFAPRIVAVKMVKRNQKP